MRWLGMVFISTDTIMSPRGIRVFNWSMSFSSFSILFGSCLMEVVPMMYIILQEKSVTLWLGKLKCLPVGSAYFDGFLMLLKCSFILSANVLNVSPIYCFPHVLNVSPIYLFYNSTFEGIVNLEAKLVMLTLALSHKLMQKISQMTCSMYDKATFTFYKITIKTLKCLPYILICHFTWRLQWFIILDMNNLVKVSHHYWMLLKLSIKLKSTWATKWGIPFSN